jgi:hypothetical protein
MSPRGNDSKSSGNAIEDAKEFAVITLRLDMIEKSNEELSKTIDEMKEKYETQFGEMRDLIQAIKDDRNKQLINWGIGIIATFITAMGAIIMKVIVPIIMANLK